MTERWLPIAGTDDLYEVSDLGRVRSWAEHGPRARREPRKSSPALLRLWPNDLGYLKVHLKGKRRVSVHRLVLAAFVGPCPSGWHGAHLDGDPSNNALTNLVWATPAENNRHKIGHGTLLHGEKHPSSKLTDAQVAEIRSLFGKAQLKEIARRFGVSDGTIGSIYQRSSWRHPGELPEGRRLRYPRLHAPAVGERVGNAKLTEAAVREILASEESDVDLAARLGVARRTVNSVRRGESWNHISGKPNLRAARKYRPLTEDAA